MNRKTSKAIAEYILFCTYIDVYTTDTVYEVCKDEM